jgi:hypothetical protein
MFILMYVRRHLVFEVQPNNVLTQFFGFISVGHLNPLVYSAPIENEETKRHFTSVFLIPVNHLKPPRDL